MKNIKWIIATLMLTLGCSSQRGTQKASSYEQELQQGTEQIELLTQREALLQGLVITFDSVALTVPLSRKPIDSYAFQALNDMGFLSADSVPPHEVNLIARKATLQKSDIRTVTFEGLNARSDTIAKHDEIVEITKENEHKDSGGKPPNWTVILIVLGSLMITGIYLIIKAQS